MRGRETAPLCYNLNVIQQNKVVAARKVNERESQGATIVAPLFIIAVAKMKWKLRLHVKGELSSSCIYP